MSTLRLGKIFGILGLALLPCLLHAQARVQVRVEPVIRAPITEQLPLVGFGAFSPLQ